MEDGLPGVAAGVGGRGGGVESLRLPLLLLLLLLVCVLGPEADRSELWPNSSSSSREILRYGASDPDVEGLPSFFRPTEEVRESASELPS